METLVINTQVTLDSSSTALVHHDAGVIPSAVLIQPAAPGQLATVPVASYTDHDFRVKFNWHDGTTFKVGTKVQLVALVCYEPAPEPQKVWSSSEPKGQWASPHEDNVFVNNEVTNAAEAGPQNIAVFDDGHWEVYASHPRAGSSDGSSIKAYPDTQFLFPARPTLGSINQLTSWFVMVAPAVGEWNAAYDIWIGGLGSKSTAEVMIWTDHRYPGPLPPSNAIEKAVVSIDGRLYDAWRRKNGNGGDYIALVDRNHRQSGEVDILHVFQWLISKGWLKAENTLAAVDFGVEIANTGGSAQTFKGHMDLVIN